MEEQQPDTSIDESNTGKGETLVLGDNIGMKPEINANKIEKVIIYNIASTSDTSPPSGEQNKHHARSLSSPFLKSGGTTFDDMNAGDLANSDVTATIIEELSRNLIKKSEHAEALELLEKALRMRRHNQLMSRLMMVECHIHMNRCGLDVFNSIEGFKKWLVTSSNVNYDELKTLADSYQDVHPVRAIILRFSMARWSIKVLPPDDAVEEIWEECVNKTSKIVTSLSYTGDENLGIASKTGIELMVKMLDNLRATDGTEKTKTVREAKCLKEIGDCYRSVGEIRKAIDCYSQGLEVMKLRLREKAIETKIFGELKKSLATANEGAEKQKERDSEG